MWMDGGVGRPARTRPTMEATPKAGKLRKTQSYVDWWLARQVRHVKNS